MIYIFSVTGYTSYTLFYTLQGAMLKNYIMCICIYIYYEIY